MEIKNILLVEGIDDLHVLGHVLSEHITAQLFTKAPSILSDHHVQIRETGGINKLLDEVLPAIIDSQSGLERLGIVVDADTNLDARWQQLRSRLAALGYTQVPQTPDPHGTIIQQEGQVAIGVWIMPDNQSRGMLEDFLRFLVPDHEHNALWHRVNGCVQQIPDNERLFTPEHQTKALIHTWLAWQKEPGVPFGTAIKANYLDPKAKYSSLLVAWVRQLFQLS